MNNLDTNLLNISSIRTITSILFFQIIVLALGSTALVQVRSSKVVPGDEAPKAGPNTTPEDKKQFRKQRKKEAKKARQERAAARAAKEAQQIDAMLAQQNEFGAEQQKLHSDKIEPLRISADSEDSDLREKLQQELDAGSPQWSPSGSRNIELNKISRRLCQQNSCYGFEKIEANKSYLIRNIFKFVF